MSYKRLRRRGFRLNWNHLLRAASHDEDSCEKDQEDCDTGCDDDAQKVRSLGPVFVDGRGRKAHEGRMPQKRQVGVPLCQFPLIVGGSLRSIKIMRSGQVKALESDMSDDSTIAAPADQVVNPEEDDGTQQ